ncbi:MAG: hypothetical protein OXB89_05060 [Anaerolineaceae bacterium]|nr:hypothetical protein [Anaerolineaceae bacterium]
MTFLQDLEQVNKSRSSPGDHLNFVMQEAARNPESGNFRKVRGPRYAPLDSGYFLEASLYRAHVGGSGGHRAFLAILKMEHERKRFVVATFLSPRTKQAGFAYDFGLLDERLEQVVQDYIEQGLSGDTFAPWQNIR